MSRAGDLAPETVDVRLRRPRLQQTAGGASTYAAPPGYTRLGELSRLDLGATGRSRVDSLYYEDGTRRLLRSLVVRDRTDGSNVDDFRYQYDPIGNVTQISDVPAGGPADQQCFAYDYLRRMTEAWTVADVCGSAPAAAAVGGMNPFWTTYGYDLTGNRTAETQHGLGGAADTARTYAYPAPRGPARTSSPR